MELHIVLEERRDMTGQIYRQLRDAIQSGTIVTGEQLPPSRLLSEQLGVSRKTVAEAYAKLTTDKLLTSQIDVGTFVAKLVKSPLIEPPRKGWCSGGQALERHQYAPSKPCRGRRLTLQVRRRLCEQGTIPVREWRRCVLAAVRADASERGRYADAEGLRELREAVVRYADFSRGVHCNWQDVLIINGAQQALDLISRVLVDRGATVVTEEPGYPPARLLFESQVLG